MTDACLSAFREIGTAMQTESQGKITSGCRNWRITGYGRMKWADSLDDALIYCRETLTNLKREKPFVIFDESGQVYVGIVIDDANGLTCNRLNNHPKYDSAYWSPMA